MDGTGDFRVGDVNTSELNLTIMLHHHLYF